MSVLLRLLILLRASIEGITVNLGTSLITNLATVISSAIIVLLLTCIIFKKFSFPRIFLPFVIFFNVSLLGIFWSESKVGFIIDFVRMFSYFALLWITMELTNKKNLNSNLVAFLSALFIPFLFGTFQLILNKGIIQFEKFNRIYGTFRHPSDYGYFLFIYLIIFLVFLINHYKKKYIGLGIVIFLLLMCHILFTFSRMVWLISFVALFMIILLNIKRKILYILLVFLLIPWILLIPLVIDRFEVEFFRNEEIIHSKINFGNIIVVGSPVSRYLFIKSAIEEFIKSPILGRGLGSFYYSLSLKRFGFNVETHSDIVKLLYETGVIGTILFLVALYRLFSFIKLHYKKTKDTLTQSFCLTGLILIVTKVIQMTLDASLRLADSEFYWWTWLGIILAVIKINKK